MKKKRLTKAALFGSLILLALWSALGTSSSIAWFQDEAELVNALYFGDLQIKLYYNDAGTYRQVDATTTLFESEDLYEPGFTHITYFKIENAGTVPFAYDLSVIPDEASKVIATGVLGNSIDLSDYIRFGLVVGDTEEAVMNLVQDRESARTYAVNRLSNYSQSGGTLAPAEVGYAALILYMPEEVGNVANYRGDDVPAVSLGIAAIANQIRP